MVNYNDDALNQLFHALADPTRRAMLQALAHHPQPVGALAAPFEISLAAASKHIRVLERAGLLTRQVQGRSHICQLNAAPMHGGMEWIRHYEQFWHHQLDTLEHLLEAEDAAKADPESRRDAPST